MVDILDLRDLLELVNCVMWDFNWEVLDVYFFCLVMVGYVIVMF